MPKFSPLCFNLPVNPSIQVMRSLDSYNDVELKKGDGAEITKLNEVSIQATQDSEVLFIDLPQS